MSGGIAAYKACELLRRFTESGHDVTVVPTAAALEFVGAATWAALSGKPVPTDVWTGVHEVPHVRIGQGADLVVVAPATADLLAKAAHGLADDLLTNTLLTARCPVVFAPAMHTEMWEHPATQANVATLRARGAVVIEPAEGRLTGVDTGKGRLRGGRDLRRLPRRARPGRRRPRPRRTARGRLRRRHPGVPRPGALPRQPLLGLQGTRWPAPPRRARRRGDPGQRQRRAARPGRREGRAGRDHRPAARRRGHRCRLRRRVVMAAAPADFRPVEVSGSKIKKAADGSAPSLALTQNPDILHEISTDRVRLGSVIVGFAAETGDDTGSVLDLARAKLARKGCGPARGQRRQRGSGLRQPRQRGGHPGRRRCAVVDVPHGSKSALAHVIWDEVASRLQD